MTWERDITYQNDYSMHVKPKGTTAFYQWNKPILSYTCLYTS